MGAGVERHRSLINAAARETKGEGHYSTGVPGAVLIYHYSCCAIDNVVDPRKALSFLLTTGAKFFIKTGLRALGETMGPWKACGNELKYTVGRHCVYTLAERSIQEQQQKEHS